MTHRPRLLAFGLCAALSGAAAAAPANDFPTLDRVLYVQECIRTNPGPAFEMTSKCSCAIDQIALQVKHADYVNMSTIVNAITIGGERGGDLRDNETLKPQITRWRQLQATVQKTCFISK